MGDQPPIDSQPTISTHVLDTEQGRPAEGVPVELYGPDGRLVGHGVTDADGRIRRLCDEPLANADYRIEFRLDARFFKRAVLTFTIDDTSRSYHVPLLVAPYSIASYRGS